ncbi:hypothetical protein NQ314_017699 [Rhamnusium bicolor]|uniref:Uncharacterized protein n=1 Tax=Rhamnusium bicolor TaxID=1586634 RepID=A0AAV8WTU2_9CUCU|nr:hypothetical protein NQ314_017699 [Rhamnusium bicolor]
MHKSGFLYKKDTNISSRSQYLVFLTNKNSNNVQTEQEKENVIEIETEASNSSLQKNQSIAQWLENQYFDDENVPRVSSCLEPVHNVVNQSETFVEKLRSNELIELVPMFVSQDRECEISNSNDPIRYSFEKSASDFSADDSVQDPDFLPNDEEMNNNEDIDEIAEVETSGNEMETEEVMNKNGENVEEIQENNKLIVNANAMWLPPPRHNGQSATAFCEMDARHFSSNAMDAQWVFPKTMGTQWVSSRIMDAHSFPWVSSSVPENSPPDLNIYTPLSVYGDNTDKDQRLNVNSDHVPSSTNWGDALNNIDNNGTEETRVYKVNEKYVPIISGDVLNNVGDGGVEVSRNSNRKSTGKVSKLKNFCYYCESDVLNFARHVINNHSTELDIIKLSSMSAKSLQGRRLLAQLRNKGNFLKTANICPRRVRQSQIPGTPVLPCDNCLGFFSSKLLYRHRKNCGEKRSGRAQSEGQTTLIRNFRTDERLKREVFPRMRADKISLEAKADSLICSFGATYLRSHRKTFCFSTQTVAKYNPQTEVFEAPSFSMNTVNSFKQCCDIAINIALKGCQQYETVPAAEAEAQLRTMIHLFTANWRFEISSQAATKKAVDRLKINDKDVSAYNILVDTIYCRVIPLNRKRPGELQRMLLHTYLSCGNEKAQGKRGRGVPVLFSVNVQNNIEFMLEYRSNFVPKENLYLFAKANSKTEINGYKILSKYAQTCGAKNPTAITSTRLEKHLATLTQIFNMTDSDIEQLAAFMGHTPGVHRRSYRLPDDIYQTAKLSKLLLLMEIGGAGDYKGKSLEEIDLNMEENLLDETKCDESDMDDEIDDTNTENVVETNVNEININEAVSVKPQAEMKKTKEY